ncbi:SnoaL-like polyketide cyclase [Rhodococcus sp. OK519]|uniref:ester cyclase n=1 Tax=Rhodococcus sp. OK519 TaxID=2135729 RepID=UPI000D41D506|nr:SnoaL-like polyketide cyclase [Rhodococcus sp. OK519]
MADVPASADPEDVVDFQFEQIVNNRRHDLAATVFHPEMTIRRMGVQGAVRHLLAAGEGDPDAVPEGSETGFDYMAAILDAAFPDFRLVVGTQVAAGEVVVTRATFVATHTGEFLGLPATGRRIEFDEVLIMRVHDGRITEVWALADELSFLEQLGAVGRPREHGVPS